VEQELVEDVVVDKDVENQDEVEEVVVEEDVENQDVVEEEVVDQEVVEEAVTDQEVDDEEAGGNTEVVQTKELSELTLEDVALAIAMESLEDIDGILTRMQRVEESDEQDLEEMQSEMEDLVEKAEEIEANLQDIDHLKSNVEVVVEDCDPIEDDLDNEVCLLTSDIGKNDTGRSQDFCSMNAQPRIKFVPDAVLAGIYNSNNTHSPSPTFNPGRINTNFIRRFESPSTVQTDSTVDRPKKRLITLDQVMRRSSNSTDEMKLQREAEMEEIRSVRRSWAPPDVSDLSFNQIKKSATMPDRLKIKHVYGNDQKVDPGAVREERAKEIESVIKERTEGWQRGDDMGWVKETSSGTDSWRTKTEAELAALRQARLGVGDEVGELYTTRQELEEKARLNRELAELRNVQGSNVSNIRKELERINEGIVRKEEKVDTGSFSTSYTGMWQEERRNIQEGVERQSQMEVQGEEPLYAVPVKKPKEEIKVQVKKPTDEVVAGPEDPLEEIALEQKKADVNIKEKLFNLRKQTELEVLKMKEKTSSMVGSLVKQKEEKQKEVKQKEEKQKEEKQKEKKQKEEKQKEDKLKEEKLKEEKQKEEKQKEEERGRLRTIKGEETKEAMTVTLREKSLSTIRNAGLKVREMASGGGGKIKKQKKRSSKDL